MVGMLERGLTEEGHEVTAVRDGQAGLDELRGHKAFDVCVLDIGLPGIDGFEALSAARADGVVTPILLLTARDAVSDRVRGLQLGADDYLPKPFAFAELLARLEAISRRGRVAPVVTRLRCRDLELDSTAHRVTVRGKAVELSARQFALLELLLRHVGQAVTRTMILELVFGYKFDPGTNIVDVHISNLRQKLDAPGLPSRITTVRGVGYRLETDEL